MKEVPTSEQHLTQAEDAAVAAVRRYIDAFNVGDTEAMAAFAVPGAILEGAVRGEVEHAGASVTIGPTLLADVTGDAALVVVPATMNFKVQGEQIVQSEAILTTVLRKVAEDWRIAAWAWAKGQSAM